MDNLDQCFFCLKYIVQGEINLQDSFNSLENGSNEKTKENLIRISHYLKVPREVITENESIFSLTKTCLDCTEISRNLSDFCVQMEIIRLKINHYLHLLANQIGGSSENHSDKNESRLTSLTNLQEIVHQNCLLKVKTDQESSNPQINLEKLPNILGDVQEDILEATNVNIKFDTSSIDSCPFCDFVADGSYDLINSHIESEHPEQIKREQVDVVESLSYENNVEMVTADLDDIEHIPEVRFHPCQDCGTEFNSKDMLSKHQKLHQVKSCEKCGAIFQSSALLYRHEKECVLLNDEHLFYCQKCNKTYTTRQGLYQHKKKTCQKSFGCKCGRVFDKLTSLRNHQRKCTTVDNSSPADPLQI